MKLSNIRAEYTQSTLSETDLHSDPFQQCEKWLNEAIAAEFPHPNAMMLATVDPHTLQPSARIVLLKDLNQRGFFFYTNSLSRKGKEMQSNPKVGLSFFWDRLERQIHIEGEAQIVESKVSDQYFASRPRASQISAWASHQSTIVANRQTLEQQQEQMSKQFADGTVPRPIHWHGYCVVPHRIEFWQGRPDRMHDRLCYIKEGNSWKITRLSP
jgi:pyridoxamine 5'-phosphate oxidase